MMTDEDRTWLDSIYATAAAAAQIRGLRPTIYIDALDRRHAELLHSTYGGRITRQVHREEMIVAIHATVIGVALHAHYSYPIDLSRLADAGESGATNAPAVVPPTDARADFEAATRAMRDAAKR